MTHIDNFFDDPHLTAGNLEGSDQTFTISEVSQEEVGAERQKCPVVRLEETKKTLVLNKTNKNRIVSLYGTQVEDWKGKKIVLYPSETDFAGRTVDCIRVRQDMPTGPARVFTEETRTISA